MLMQDYKTQKFSGGFIICDSAAKHLLLKDYYL